MDGKDRPGKACASRSRAVSPHFSPDFLGNDVAHALCVPRRHSWRRSGSERCVTALRSVENTSAAKKAAREEPDIPTKSERSEIVSTAVMGCLDTARVGACATPSGGL